MTEETYSDDDLFRATGLHKDSVRKLIYWGAARPVSSKKGVIRAWNRRTIRRIARISALVNAGLSLRLAHTLSYLFILDERFDYIDPEAPPEEAGLTWHQLFGWFDSDHPLSAKEHSDMFLIIVNGDSVFYQLSNLLDDNSSPDDERQHVMVGRIDGHKFITGYDFAQYGLHKLKPESLRPKWEPIPGHHEIAPESLSWVFVPDMTSELENDDFRHPISMLRVNLSFACRLAMRRLLNIPVFFEGGRS